MYPICECGHRYDRHTDPSDPRQVGCWECECTVYTPEEKSTYDIEMGQGGAGYNDVMFGDGGD